jgi:hypothetical protein
MPVTASAAFGNGLASPATGHGVVDETGTRGVLAWLPARSSSDSNSASRARIAPRRPNGFMLRPLRQPGEQRPDCRAKGSVSVKRASEAIQRGKLPLERILCVHEAVLRRFCLSKIHHIEAQVDYVMLYVQGRGYLDRARVIIREVDNLLALKHESTFSRSNNLRPASI